MMPARLQCRPVADRGAHGADTLIPRGAVGDGEEVAPATSHNALRMTWPAKRAMSPERKARGMADRDSEVIVLGAGPAGLAAALSLNHLGVPVTLIGGGGAGGPDRRTAALMAASVRLLARLGVWSRCAPAAAPLETLRLIDDTGRLVRASTVVFRAEEIGEAAFGWNVPNAELVAALHHARAAANGIAFIAAHAERIEVAGAAVKVALDNGSAHRARLLVAADGRDSLARAAAGIAADSRRYGQTAIVANLSHERDHANVSTEFHRPAGPFTLVPLPGRRSSLVWVETADRAAALAALDEAALADEIARLSHRVLGPVALDGPAARFPLGTLTARRLAARRIALIGEAAHVLPPIGAQGLNLGLRDAAAIAEIAADAVAAGEDPGGPAVMAAYDRARRRDVATRGGAVDLLNRSLTADLVPLDVLRAAGLSALAAIGPLRRLAMREGVAPRSGLPRLMRAEDG